MFVKKLMLIRLLLGNITSGIPPFRLPPFSFERPLDPYIAYNASSNWTDILRDNQTETVTFGHILSDLGAGLALVPVIAILEQVAIAKAFGECQSLNVEIEL